VNTTSSERDYIVNHDNKLSFAEKLGYGMGDAACGIVYSSVTMFLTWFYTDIYGLLPQSE
jgi:Na+/melibiose symporter-like transporter